MPFRLVLPYVGFAIGILIIWTSLTIKYPELEKFQFPVLLIVSFGTFVLIRRKAASLQGDEHKELSRWQMKLSKFYPLKALGGLVIGTGWGFLIGNGRIDAILTGVGMAFAVYVFLVYIELSARKSK